MKKRKILIVVIIVILCICVTGCSLSNAWGKIKSEVKHTVDNADFEQ